jgi:hypothetical protein
MHLHRQKSIANSDEYRYKIAARSFAMDTIAKKSTDLPHDAWRVQFLRRLLSVHRSSPVPHSDAWKMQEMDYLQQIATAEARLRLASLGGVS